EIGAEIQAQIYFFFFSAVVENSQVFDEPVADKTAANNRKRGVLVDRARGRNAIVLSVVILDGIGRQHIECYPVGGKFPLRQVAHILEEQTLRLIVTGVYVTVGIRDEKCRTVENADAVVAHGRALPLRHRKSCATCVYGFNASCCRSWWHWWIVVWTPLA